MGAIFIAQSRWYAKTRPTDGFLVKRIIANKNITIFKVNNTELFCQVELPLSDYPLYGKQIAAS